MASARGWGLRRGLLVPGRRNSQARTGNNKTLSVWDLWERWAVRWVISIIHCLNRTHSVRTDMIHSYTKTTGRNWGHARKTGRSRQIESEGMVTQQEAGRARIRENPIPE